MLALDKNGYPRLLEDKLDLALVVPVKGSGKGNAFHDPRTGKFTWAPPGNRIAKGADLLKNLKPATRKLLFQRAQTSASNTIAARVVNGQLHVVLMRDSKRVDSFAVNPSSQGEKGEKPPSGESEGKRGEEQETPQPNEQTGGQPFTDEQQDQISAVARDVNLQGESLIEEIEKRINMELTPEQRQQVEQDVLQLRLGMLIAYLDLRLRQTARGEKISDSEFKITVGRGMLKKTVAGLGADHIRLVVQRLGGLGWTPEELREHWVEGLPKGLKINHWEYSMAKKNRTSFKVGTRKAKKLGAKGGRRSPPKKTKRTKKEEEKIMARKKKKSRRKSGIHIKKANRGKLRASTKTKKGKKIPVSKLQKLKKSKNPKTRKRATFAMNARKWKKTGRRKRKVRRFNSSRKKETNYIIKEGRRLITPQDKGRAFEQQLAREYDLHLTKGSGSGKWKKLDQYNHELVVSSKFTEKASFSITKDMLQEAIDEASGPGGRGISHMPLLVVGFEDGQITGTMDIADIMWLLEQKK